MKRFITKVLLFSSPLMIYAVVALYIDPYNLTRPEQNEVLRALKLKVSYRLNYPLYGLQEYSYSPSAIVVLGDSRTNNLKSEVFERYTKQRTVNLAYGGGTLPEIIDTFWEVNKYGGLRRVYIGINFNLYNEEINFSRVPEANQLRGSLISYLFSSYCLKSTLRICASLITGQIPEMEKPPVSSEDFWRYQLDVAANNFYRHYTYPQRYFDELSRISRYCSENSIKLVFFIPPSHIELQNKVKEFGLEDEEQTFLADLSSLGDVYNFDYPNTLTENKENFLDPFHFVGWVGEVVVKEIVGEDSGYARFTPGKAKQP